MSAYHHGRQMKTIIDDKCMKIGVIESSSDDITLCFTGVGHAIGGIDVQSEEFMRASTFSTALFIVDKLRSWGNSIDFSHLARIIHSYKSNSINAIGNSMGGYTAILASQFVDISTVVAIVPQYSVSKEILPTESRWDEYVKHITDWKYKSIGSCFRGDTSYYILAGVGGDDDKHLSMIPSQNNIHKIYFRRSRFIHNVAQILKDDGILYAIIGDCFEQRHPSDIIKYRLSRPGYGAFNPDASG